MDPILLITKEDFAGYSELSTNIREDKKLNQHILNAQELDLKPLLGFAFFHDLLKNKDSEKYQDLINGKEYRYSNIVDVNFLGLKPVLVYYSVARYTQVANVQATATGFTVKSNQYSEQPDFRMRAEMIREAESIAIGHWSNVQMFLDTHSTDFPLWKKSGCGSDRIIKKSGARISGVRNG